MPKKMTDKKETFTREFLLALANWQKGWREVQEDRRKIAEDLVEQCKGLPEKFRSCKPACFRKRFLREGEIAPIVCNNSFFEGIASWTISRGYLNKFKNEIRSDTKFTMIFKHFPSSDEVIVNIAALWNDKKFKKAAEEFRNIDSEAAYPLFNFRSQDEVVLRSTLKGTEIEDIEGISSSFDVLFDKSGLPESKRKDLSLKFTKDPGILLEIRHFIGPRPSKAVVRKVLAEFKEKIEYADKHNIPVDWSKVVEEHQEDLKYKL